MAFLDPSGVPIMDPAIQDDQSLAKQLFQYIFGLYCLIAITVTVIQIIEEYRYTQKTIEVELTNYEAIFGPVLAKALWDLDREQVNVITKGLAEVPIIVGVKIERIQGDKLIPYAGRNAKTFDLALHEQFFYQFPIVYQSSGVKHTLGQASLFSDSSIVLDRVQLGFTFLIINAVIKGVALWIIFWFVSNKLLIKPLSRLTHAISSLKFDNLTEFNIDLETHNKNELSVIEDNFNIMVDELKKSKDQVQSFNKKLEIQVRERTQDLNEAVTSAEQAKCEAEKSNLAKAEFLSTMSHELRTPINGIQGMLYLLENSPLEEKQKQYVETANASSKNLIELINNIFDASKLEQGTIKLETIEFEVFPILKQMTKKSLTDINIERLSIILEAEKIKGLKVIGDPNRLSQIVHNLVSNAITYTNEGEIRIEAQYHEIMTHGKPSVKLIVAIKDTGIGIEEEKQHTLFQTFTQADTSSTREHSGAGLGLFICKKLCELMGGNISVQSQVGKGSLFQFEVNFRTLN